MNYSLLLLLCSALFVPRAHGVTSVATNLNSGTTAATTFKTAVNAAAFYRPTRTMFFGLIANSTADFPSTNALGYTDDSSLTYTGIAWTGAADIALNMAPQGTNDVYTVAEDNAQIQSSNITALDVVGDPSGDSTTGAFTSSTRGVLNNVRIVFLSSKAANSSILPVGVFCMTPTLGVPVYKSLTDVDSAATINTFTVVAGNAGMQMCAFATVKAAASGNNVNRANYGLNDGDGVVALTIAADNGMSQVSTYAGSSLLTTASLVYGPNAGSNQTGGPAMCYDETLRRLYVGSQYTTASADGNGTAGGLSVQIYDVSADTGKLSSLYSCGVNTVGAYDGGAAVVDGNNIIGVRGNSLAIAALKLKVMHTSAGPSPSATAPTVNKFAYLIVNGGNGAAATVSNQVWSVPLVVGDTTNNITTEGAVSPSVANIGVINGTFANVKTADYSERADASGELHYTNTAAAKVGNGPLPCSAGTAPSDMWVDGDAVYCSIDAAATNAITPGVWHSQACFNAHGQIDHWTEWCRVSPLELGGVVATNKGRVGFFAVDAASTQIWGIDASGKELRSSQWQNSSTDGVAVLPAANASGLLTILNKSVNMGDGCTAVCDLNSSSTGWGATTPSRITLFGGKGGRVCFAMTGSTIGAPDNIGGSKAGSIVSTNTGLNTYIDYDYSLMMTGTFKKTTLPGDRRRINTLAFSGWNAAAANDTPGFFFAGVQEDGGLYVWAKASLGAGFDPRDVTDLDAHPFRRAGDGASPASWQVLPAFDGIPTKVESRGGGVYILSRSGGLSGKEDRIFRLTRQNTATLLDADFCVPATSKSGSLSNVSRIYDFVVTVTALSDTVAGSVSGEQLMMLTNDGIYTTTCSIGTSDSQLGKTTAANAQAISGWVKMSSPPTDNTWQSNIKTAPYTRDPQTFWMQVNEISEQYSSYEWGTYKQLSRDSLLSQRGNDLNDGRTVGNWQFNPTFFNGFDGTTTEPTNFNQLRYTELHYTDGSRRIFQFLGTSSGLFAVPYEVAAKWWNITSTTSEVATNLMTHVHWISTIGSTGKLFAGGQPYTYEDIFLPIATYTGVVGLV